LNHFNNNLIINTKPKTNISVSSSHGDLAELDSGVNGEGYIVDEAVDGAAKKVRSGVEVGHGGRSKGFHSGQITISDYDWDKQKNLPKMGSCQKNLQLWIVL
jgi:hypothetical protein